MVKTTITTSTIANLLAMQLKFNGIEFIDTTVLAHAEGLAYLIDDEINLFEIAEIFEQYISEAIANQPGCFTANE